jgi:hypothetical protein
VPGAPGYKPVAPPEQTPATSCAPKEHHVYSFLRLDIALRRSAMCLERQAINLLLLRSKTPPPLGSYGARPRYLFVPHGLFFACLPTHKVQSTKHKVQL